MTDRKSTGAKLETFVIGHWTFTPHANELSAGDVRRRLEHRATRTLELLCRNRGRILSQEEIISEVWSGRSVSPNSVSIVIGALRQALDDHSRDCRLIETIAKRGYRLRLQDNEPQSALAKGGPFRLRNLSLLTGSFLAMLACLFVWTTVTPARTLVLLPSVLNETGNRRYDPLTSATDALILTRLQALRDVDVIRAPQRVSEPGAVQLDTRLVIWNGKPLVTFAARTAEGQMIWANSSTGKEGLIPRDVILLIRQFELALAKRKASHVPRSPDPSLDRKSAAAPPRKVART